MSASNNEQNPSTPPTAQISLYNDEQTPTIPPAGPARVDEDGSPIPAAELARRAAVAGIHRAVESAYARKFRLLRIIPGIEINAADGIWTCPNLPAAYHQIRDDPEIAKHVKEIHYEVPAHTGKAVALHWLILLMEEVKEVENVDVKFGIEVDELGRIV